MLFALGSGVQVPIPGAQGQPPAGDILVADRSAGTGILGSLFDVNPSTGTRTRISDFGNAVQGPTGRAPAGVKVEASGNILVVDRSAGTGGKGALFRVDPSTGTRSLLSDFGNAALGTTGAFPTGLVIESSGNILVIDRNAGTSLPACAAVGGGCGALFRVDPSTGVRTVVSDFGNSAQGPTGVNPVGVAIEASGNIVVIDRDAGTAGPACFGLGCGALFRVNSSTGVRTIVSDFGNGALGTTGVRPSGITIDASGNILVTDPSAGTASYSACSSSGCGALFRVDPSTGVRTVVSDFGNAAQGPLGIIPQGLAIDASGNILVIDEGAGTLFAGALFRVNPSTGLRTVVSDFGNSILGPTGLDPTALFIVGETRAGSNIFVGFPQFSPSGLRLTYGVVTTRGISSVTSAAASNCQKGSVAVQVGTCFQFTFSGTFSGGATITLPYTAGLIPSGRSESEIRLFHIKADGTVEDLTTSVDTANKRVTGTANSFQFFVAGLPSTTTTTATSTTTTSTTTSATATTAATTSITTIVTSVTSTVTGITTSFSVMTSTITTLFTTGAPIPGNPPASIAAGLIFGVIVLFGLRRLRHRS